LKSAATNFDVLPLNKSNEISYDGARLIRVVRGVGDNRCAIRARQLERILQMFRVRRIERLARNVAVSGWVHFRVEIAQPDINTKGRPA
jgi:hypothetical protein